MKMSKIASLILAGSAFALIGCGSGGGSSTSNSTPATKVTKVTASDAYVVSLPDPATITLANGQSYATTKVDGNGTVVFDNLPADANLTGAKVHIPDTAIVDTDGDGKLSAGDQTIRMALNVKYGDKNNSNIVANPITTVAVDKNNTKVLREMAHFDPVKAKLQLTQDYNETLAKEVALNDAVANAIKNAKDKNESTKNVINSIDIDNLKNIIDNPSVDVKTALETSLNNVDDQTAVDKAVKVVTLAQDINKLVKEGKVKPHEGLIALIAVSDANVSVTTAKTALEDGNISRIIHSLPKDERVQIHLEMKQNEMKNHAKDMDKDHDMMDIDHDMNQSHEMDMDHDMNQSHEMDMDHDMNQSHGMDMDHDTNQTNTSNIEQKQSNNNNHNNTEKNKKRD